MIRPGEIYLVNGVALGTSRDSRPCLVLLVYPKTARLCFFSTQFDSADGDEITLLKSDADFPASGLKVNVPEAEIPIAVLDKSPRMGVATGEFRRKVEEFYGVKF